MSGVKIVIARYTEPVDWIQNLNHDFIVYNKGNQIDPKKIDPKNVINVPNDGREAETYLRYIVDHYENTPPAVVFLQGNPFDHYPKVLETIENIGHVESIIPLSSETFCDLMGNDSYPGLPVGYFRNLILPGYSDSERIDFIAGAQFIVPGNLIKNKPLEWWVSLKETYNQYWFSNIRSGYGIRPGQFIGHVFERLWPSIFKYEIPNEN